MPSDRAASLQARLILCSAREFSTGMVTNGSQLQPNYRFHSTPTSSKMTPLFELRPWFDEGQ